MSTTLSHSQHARDAVQALRSSKIREVANAGMGRSDVLPFWFGEPDEPTPDDVRAVASQRLAEGDTFYVQTLGLPNLRDAIAAYVSKLHRPHAPFDAGNVAVTSSGTSALMLAMQAIVNPGDRLVAVTPLWPNLVEMPKVLGAQVDTVSLRFAADGWQLDLDALLTALRPGTRALLINSPNNPTGWVMTADDQRAVLEHCRQRGIWIVTDDVYERYYYDHSECAPSFLDIADANDRVISCNSFSKAWLMTGWRIGWIVVPRPLLQEIGKLIEFSTTCTPGFLQHAALHALEHGEAVIARTVARLKQSRNLLATRLAQVPGVQLAAPSPGAMYSFFRVDGVTDSLAFCKQLVAEGGLGLAPGAAFGPEGEGFLRWCYASTPERIELGVERLSRYLGKRR